MLRMRFARPVLLALAACAGMVAASPACGQVHVNEILGDPGFDWNGDGAVSARDDEWVEIVNGGTDPVVLDEYRLSDGGNRILRYGFSGTLLPGAVQVVFGSVSVAWESAHGVSAVGLSLNNAGDSVRLWKIAAADTVLVDSYTYAAFEVLDDRSVGRVPDGGPEWRLWDRHTPYSGTTPPLGTGCEPTPGTQNQCPTAVEQTPWSHVKRLYQGAREAGLERH
jgi:hypothetical protein